MSNDDAINQSNLKVIWTLHIENTENSKNMHMLLIR